MLARFKDETSIHIVMGILIDQTSGQTQLIFSEFGNSHGQYPQKITDVEIVDQHIPGNWVVSYNAEDNEVVISFPEWANDPGQPGKPGFYERYTNGEAREAEVMARYYAVEYEKYKNTPDLLEGRD